MKIRAALLGLILVLGWASPGWAVDIWKENVQVNALTLTKNLMNQSTGIYPDRPALFPVDMVDEQFFQRYCTICYARETQFVPRLNHIWMQSDGDFHDLIRQYVFFVQLHGRGWSEHQILTSFASQEADTIATELVARILESYRDPCVVHPESCGGIP